MPEALITPCYRQVFRAKDVRIQIICAHRRQIFYRILPGKKYVNMADIGDQKGRQRSGLCHQINMTERNIFDAPLT